LRLDRYAHRETLGPQGICYQLEFKLSFGIALRLDRYAHRETLGPQGICYQLEFKLSHRLTGNERVCHINGIVATLPAHLVALRSLRRSGESHKGVVNAVLRCVRLWTVFVSYGREGPSECKLGALVLLPL
jgi:hypothetical protein